MTPEELNEFGERSRTRILAQHDQEIEEALELSRDNVPLMIEVVLLTEKYKKHTDDRMRYIGLLLSIGYNVCAESKYQRGQPETDGAE